MSEEKITNPEVEGAEVAVTASNPVLDKLAAFGGNDESYEKALALGVESVDDLAELTVEDLVEIGVKKVQARKLLASFKVGKTSATEDEPKADINISIDPSSILPQPMDDSAWLSALKSGGVLKVNESSYISAIRAAYADKCGLFKVPALLRDEMEIFAEDNDEPVGEEYFKIQKMLTRHDYGEIFSAIDGLDGSFVSQKKKDKFLKKTHDVMWPAIRTAFEALDAWYESLSKVYSNPSMMMAMFAGMSSGAPIVNAAAQIPPTDPVRDASDNLKDAINHVFGGFGVPVATALCYDARQIGKILENPGLPAMVGAANREMMLKQLDINVNSLYARQEQNMVRFVLGFVKLDEMTTAGDDSRYLTALWQIGNQLGFKSISSYSGASSIGGEDFFV